MPAPTNSNTDKNTNLPAADTGNASNPTPHPKKIDSPESQQLLNEKAETYLRESGNIEDLPDPQEEQEADEIIEKEKGNQADKNQ